MVNMIDKINCPYCNYPIPKDEVVCPVCDEIIANYTSEVAKDETDEEVVKTSSSYLHTYTTDPIVIKILTGMFCLGVCLLFLFYFIEYNPTVLPGRRRFTMSDRQFYFVIITAISIFLSSNTPFQKKAYLPQRLLGCKRVASLVFYSSYLLVLVLIWYFYASNFIINDLNNYYYNKIYAEDFDTLVLKNRPAHIPVEHIEAFTDNASLSANQSAKEKTPTFVNPLFLFYKITYILGVVLIYLPFILYYAFNLDFLYSDSEPYIDFFETAFGIPTGLIFLYYLYLKSGSFIALVIVLTLSRIAWIASRDRKLRIAYIFILTIVIFAIAIIYMQRQSLFY